MHKRGRGETEQNLVKGLETWIPEYRNTLNKEFFYNVQLRRSFRRNLWVVLLSSQECHSSGWLDILTISVLSMMVLITIQTNLGKTSYIVNHRNRK